MPVGFRLAFISQALSGLDRSFPPQIVDEYRSDISHLTKNAQA